jgi:hypothetical protein
VQNTVTVTGTVGTTPGALTTIVSGTLTGATSGTPTQMAAQACKTLRLEAPWKNSDVVVVGESTIVVWSLTRQGLVLWPGDTIDIQIDNMNRLYYDALAYSDSLRWTALS